MPHGHHMNLQSLLFARDKYTPKEAIEYLKEHDIEPIKKVHKTEHYLRYRITSPKDYKRYRTSAFSNNIKAIIGYK